MHGRCPGPIRKVLRTMPDRPTSRQPLWRGQRAPVQQEGRPGWAHPPEASAPAGRPWVLFLPAVGLVVLGAVVVGLLLGEDDDERPFDELTRGDCLVSAELRDLGGTVDEIEVVDCSETHDAEVVATYRLGPDEGGAGFDLDAAGSACHRELRSAGTSLRELEAVGAEVRPLVAGRPAEGDQVLCIARARDGARRAGAFLA